MIKKKIEFYLHIFNNQSTRIVRYREIEFRDSKFRIDITVSKTVLYEIRSDTVLSI